MEVFITLGLDQDSARVPQEILWSDESVYRDTWWLALNLFILTEHKKLFHEPCVLRFVLRILCWLV